jgi:hypothetical protein
MTIQDWGALGEVIGGIAIIVSLIYVGAQIKQNTKATKVATDHAFLNIHGALLAPITTDKEFRDIYWRGLGGLSNLQGNEPVAFGAWAIHTFRAWETFWYQWQGGIFDDHVWEGWRVQFCDLFAYTGILETWDSRKHQLSEEFREYVDQNIIDEKSKPLYVFQEVEDM